MRYRGFLYYLAPRFEADKPCHLSRYVVEGAVHALLEVVRRRARAGQGTYWQYVGVFSVVEHKARRRWIWTTKGGTYWEGHIVSPAVKRIAFRPAACMVEWGA